MKEANSHNSFWSALSAFFQRDIRSFFNTNQRQITITDDFSLPEIPTVDSITLLPPLLDIIHLEHVKYRRQMLDWRDEAIIQLSSTGRNSFRGFCYHMDYMLDEVPILRRVISQSSNEVLQDTFNMMVRSKIRNQAVQAVDFLLKTLTSQGFKIGTPALVDKFPDSELSCIEEYGFKPSNHDEIFSALELLVIGEKGIIKMFQYQIIRITEDLIGKPLQ